MTSDTFGRASEFFLEARKLGLAERDEYLDRVCGDDARLRADVEALLHGEDKPLPLETLAEDLRGIRQRVGMTVTGMTPANDRTPHTGGDLTTLATSASEPANHIGPYKLIEKIGEGGFGVVYLAEQEQPVRRRVALKIIKLGMDTRQVVARFEAERQALAMMDHPHIARVFDGGATGTGRPYFVMELVRGTPVTEYCDRHQLSPRQRLELFIPICQAVQHAHQKGVIHRDLKPSNVLVMQHDDKASPKVIDFGIAKATGGRLTDKTIVTEFRQMIGTPEYMSPEQAGMSDLDIDTRSDIYSLGVLLYELLTGTTPFDLRSKPGSSFADIQRIIREVEPPKPSTRLEESSKNRKVESSKTDDGSGVGRAAPRSIAMDGFASPEQGPAYRGSSAINIARHRKTDPHSLARMVRGDLDWIVMKCLEKDRTRRYDTANGLAADLERHLNGEPVQAAPPSAAYRLRKFVRRNRAVVSTGVFVFVALLVGIVGTAWQAQRANRAADAARRVNDFYVRVLGGVNPFELEWRQSGEIMRVPTADAKAADILRRGADSIGNNFADRPDLEVEVRRTIGQALCGAGLETEGIAQIRASLELAQRTLPPADPSRLASMRGLGVRLYDWMPTRTSPEHVKLLESYLAQLRRLYGDNNPRTLDAMMVLGWSLVGNNRGKDSEAVLREALQRGEVTLGSEHQQLVGILTALNCAVGQQGRFADAITFGRRAVAMCPHVYKFYSAGWVQALDVQIQNLNALEQSNEAEPVGRELIKAARAVYGENHKFMFTYRRNFVFTLHNLGRDDEAEQVVRDQIASAQKRPDDDPLRYFAEENLAFYLANAGKYEEALQHAQAAVVGMQKATNAEPAMQAMGAATLATILIQTGHADQAESVVFSLVQAGLQAGVSINDGKADYPLLWGPAGRAYIKLGHHEDAEQVLSDLYQREYKKFGPEHANTRAAAADLVTLYDAWKKPDKAAGWRAKMGDPKP